MQMISIAKSLFHNVSLISLDEPTASLSSRETGILFDLIGNLKKKGMTILYVSHRLEEIFYVADRVTILRDGTYIGTFPTKEISREELIRKMVGRDVAAFAYRKKDRVFNNEVVLKVESLSKPGIFHDISFELRKGEILGFSGLVGSRRTDVVRSIFGADSGSTGKISIKGKGVVIGSPRIAMKYGLGLIPEDRKTEGVIRNLSNEDNIGIACMNKFTAGGIINHRKKRDNCRDFIRKINVNPPDPRYITSQLSGGNQQKIILARWLSTDAEIMILDEPTKGIDVGAKEEIYLLLEDLVHQGKSVIMISSELPEIIGICDRVIVMHEGRKTAELDYEELSEEGVLHYAMGGVRNEK
jgi:ABC-type sugar transport system ATPase subunit